jgi:hypothetical protein
MAYLFIDCEFTDFKHMDLISIGAVTEDGDHEFYVEITDHIADYRSDFVNQVVMPLLDYSKYGKSYDWACLGLKDWIDSLPYPEITVVCDYVGDWHLMSDMLQRQRPEKNIHAQMLNASFMQMLHHRGIHTSELISKAYGAMVNAQPEYFTQDPRQHHALVDARAFRHAWTKGYNAAL